MLDLVKLRRTGPEQIRGGPTAGGVAASGQNDFGDADKETEHIRSLAVTQVNPNHSHQTF